MHQHHNVSKCLSDRSLRLITSDVDALVLKFVFPPEFIFGVLGNSLNLWILTCHSMRNRANDLLAAVSLCDLLFFVFMLPHSLAGFNFFSRNLTFRYYYVIGRQELLAFANWCSAAAIWFIFAVTIERFLVIISPLRSRIYWRKSERCFVIATIVVMTGLLTMYHHFEHNCRSIYYCNNTQLYTECYSAGTNFNSSDNLTTVSLLTELRRHYIQISTVSNAIFVVFVPIMAVGVLNMLLIRRLQKHDKMVLSTQDSCRNIVLAHQHRQKRHATITVILISSCFALTQGPSAIMSLWELLIGYSHKNSYLFVFMSITNALVITGKTINFVLFCLSSAHFRTKCAMILFRKFPKLGQTSFGRNLSEQMRGSKPDFRSSVQSLPLSQRRANSQASLNRARLGSKKFCSQLQPLAEVSAANSVDESNEHVQHNRLLTA